MATCAWRANVRRIYLLKMLLAGPAISVPVITLFWRKVGMSTTEIFLVQGIFHAALALFEVPTGRFADRTGRKPSVVLGVLSLAIGFTAYVFASDIWGVIAAELVIALGASFVSGSLQALQYDSVLAFGSEGADQQVFGRSSTMFFVACAVFTVLGGVLGDIDIKWALVGSAVPMWLAIPVVLGLTEAPYRNGEPDVPLGKVVREQLLGSSETRWIVLFCSVVSALLVAGLWFYQDYFKDCGLPVWAFGASFAGCNVVAAVASRWARSRDWKGAAIFVVPGFLFAGYLTLGVVTASWGFLLILLLQVARGCNDVALDVRLNRSIASNVRATVLSLKSLCTSAIFAALGLGVGIVGDCCGMRAALLVLAALTAAAIAVFWLTRPDRRKIAAELPDAVATPG